MNFKKLFLLTAFIGSALVGYVLAASYPYYHSRWLGTGTRRGTEEFSLQTPSAGAAAIFVPGTTNTNALGSTALRFSAVYATAFNSNSATNVFAVYSATAPRQGTVVGAIYSAQTVPAGTLFLNTTENGLCFSTGTVQSSIVIATAPTTACR